MRDSGDWNRTSGNKINLVQSACLISLPSIVRLASGVGLVSALFQIYFLLQHEAGNMKMRPFQRLEADPEHVTLHGTAIHCH